MARHNLSPATAEIFPFTARLASRMQFDNFSDRKPRDFPPPATQARASAWNFLIEFSCRVMTDPLRMPGVADSQSFFREAKNFRCGRPYGICPLPGGLHLRLQLVV